MPFRSLVIGIQISFDVRDVGAVELDQAVSEIMHGPDESRHFRRQEIDEAVDGPDVQAFGKLDPRVWMKSAADEAHVYPVEPAAVTQQDVVDFRPGAQLFEVHQLSRPDSRAGMTGSCT